MNRLWSAAVSKTSRSRFEPSRALRLVPLHPAHSRAPVRAFNARNSLSGNSAQEPRLGSWAQGASKVPGGLPSEGRAKAASGVFPKSVVLPGCACPGPPREFRLAKTPNSSIIHRGRKTMAVENKKPFSGQGAIARDEITRCSSNRFSHAAQRPRNTGQEP